MVVVDLERKAIIGVAQGMRALGRWGDGENGGRRDGRRQKAMNRTWTKLKSNMHVVSCLRTDHVPRSGS